MALPRKIKLLLIGLVVFVAVAALATCFLWSHLERYATGIHHRSVTRSLAEWRMEYGSITNDAFAVTAGEMVGYIPRYYVPGPGYRSSVEIEAALERQRADTLRHLIDALQQYTGLDYGTNTQKWEQWAEQHRNSESNGATNRGEPIRSATNQASAMDVRSRLH
jgi:hypothetical protein